MTKHRPKLTNRNRSLLSVARKQLIVTGGAGFIGSHLVAALNAAGEHNLTIVDRLGTGSKWRNLRGLRFEEMVGVDDFRERVRRHGIPAGSTVFHLGAPGTETANAEALVDGIFRYSQEIAKACLQSGARMIYASSAATYGHGDFGFFDNDNTTERLCPETPYAFAKHLFDLWALQQGHFDNLVGLKLFNVYGPNEAHKGSLRSHVAKFIEEARETGRVTLPRSQRSEYKDGDQARDFTHVEDVVAALLFFHEHADTAGLFNCGTGQARTLNDVAKIVFKALGKEPEIVFEDIAPERRAACQHFVQADISKARAAGLEVEFRSVERGIADLLKPESSSRAAA